MALYVVHFAGSVAAGLSDVPSVTPLSNACAHCPCVIRAALASSPTVYVMKTYQLITVWLHVFSFNPPFNHDSSHLIVPHYISPPIL
jgi:hypothetical protein